MKLQTRAAALSRYPDAIANQWLHLGIVSWITRIEGFSMLIETEFGAFSPRSDLSSGRWIGDASVGLNLRTDSVQNCGVTGDPERGDIQFFLNMQSDAEMYISKRGVDTSLCPVLSRISETFGLDGQSGSTPWLDEWSEIPEACRSCPLACYRAADQISSWREVRIDIKTTDLTIQTSISPSSADRDGTVLRIFDSGKQQTLYIDLLTPGLKLESNEDGGGAIHLHTFSQN